MPSSRVVLNKAALDQTQRAIGEGVKLIARSIAEQAASRAPDATPFGVGLVDQWGVLVYVNGKKIDDASGDGSTVKKPRGARTSKTGGLEAFVGFGFPGRFQETGTVNHAAQPFFTPAVMGVLPSAQTLMRAAAAQHLPRKG